MKYFTLGTSPVGERASLVHAPSVRSPLVTAFDGDELILTVEFDGYPLPSIKWYHHNIPVTGRDEVTINTVDGKSTATIPLTEDAAGEWGASASNEAGEAKTSSSVKLPSKYTLM